jgi:N-acetylmuramoyl-L-alanine amidase
MKQRLLTAVAGAALVAAGALAFPTEARAQAGARDMYTRALAQERTIRDAASHATADRMRRVVAAYETLVRRYPSSGYCDNALWQAGNVSALAYQRFGDEADRKAAIRLFDLLARGYPASKLVPQAKTAVSDLNTTSLNTASAAIPPTSPLPASTTPAPASAPVSPATRSERESSAAGSSGTATSQGKTPRSDLALPATGSAALLRQIHRTVLPDGVRVTVDLDAEISYYQEEIENPRRVFFDLKNVKASPSLQDASLKFDGDLVTNIRLGRHPQNTTRLVVDLDGVSNYSVYPLYGPYRLVIDFRRAVATVPVSTPPPTALAVAVPPPMISETKAAATLSKLPQTRPSVPQARTPATEPPLPSSPAPAKALPPVPPMANSNGKFSLSRQLGLGVSRVVIDAGHGGHDPGAQGNGIVEAELTLDIALRVQKLLEKEPGMDVVMTRSSDIFIPLEERTAIANREGADLFLSIHANASRNATARGIETYFLNFAMNPEAEAVAARENATSVMPMHNLPDIVKAIALNNKINESRDLASAVQKSMTKRLAARNRSLRDLGVKQAPFVVLIGAGMPSVLAEISFVTNRQEGALLKTNAYRQQIAQALCDAVVDYQQSLKRLNAIGGKKATY